VNEREFGEKKTAIVAISTTTFSFSNLEKKPATAKMKMEFNGSVESWAMRFMSVITAIRHF
jgi:hypothetical protein